MSSHIERIELNNEIVLQLESAPAVGPGEAKTTTLDCFDNNPLKHRSDKQSVVYFCTNSK